MTEKEQKELTDRAIPGITWKQIAGFIVIMWTLMFVYLKLVQSSEAATKKGADIELLIKEFLKEYKINNELKDTQINQLKIEQRELDYRLKQLEKNWNNFIEGFNNGSKKYK